MHQHGNPESEIHPLPTIEHLRMERLRGSLLEHFGREETREIFLTFKESFAEHPPEVQSELLEIFLRDGVVEKSELLEILGQLDEEQKGALGVFLGKNIPPCSHLEAFHRCWEHIDYRERGELERRFTRRDSEHVIMVAPFINVARRLAVLPDGEPIPGRKRRNGGGSDVVTVAHAHFADFDSASALLEAGLKLDRWYNGPDLIAHYVETQPTFLGPYLPRLIEKNLITPKQIKELMFEDKSYIIASCGFFENPEEKAEYKRIVAKVKQLRPNDKDIENDSWNWPDTFNERSELLMERYRLRQAEHLCRGFLALEEHFPDREAAEKYLIKLHDGGVPIVHGMRCAGFSAGRIEAICRAIEQEGYDVLSAYGTTEIRDLCELGLEKVALRGLAKEIRDEGNLTRLLRHVGNDISSVLDMFSPESRGKLCGLISKSLPSMWCRDLETMESRGGMSVATLVKRLASDDYSFADNYMRIMGHIRRRQTAGRPTDCTVADLQKTAMQVLERNPSMVFFKPFCNQLMDQRSRQAFVLERLKGEVDQNLIVKMVREYDESEYLKSCRNELRAVLIGNPGILKRIANDYGWRDLEPILEPKERLGLLCGELDGSSLKKMAENSCLMKDLLKHSPYFARFMRAAEQEDNPATMVTLYKELGSMLRPDRYSGAPKVSPGELQRGEQALGRLRDRIVARCNAEPFLVFNEDLLDVLSDYAKPIVARHARDYLRLNPSFLPVLQRENALDPELSAELVMEHARALVMMRDKYGYVIYRDDKLEPEQLTHLRSLCPLDRLIGRGTLKRDFYDEALAELEGSPFLEIYRSRMETIAMKEQKENGPRLKVDVYSLNQEFLGLLQRISALEACPIAWERKEEILGLPPKQREEMIDLIKLAICYNLDKEVEPRIEGAPLETVRQELAEALAERMKALFRVEDLGSRGMMDFDIELLRAMAVYYGSTCQEDLRMTRVLREVLVRASHGEFQSWRDWGCNQEPAGEEARSERLKAMKQEGLLPPGLKLAQYEKWLEPVSATIEEEFDYDPRQLGSAIRRYLAQAVADHHIAKEELEVDYDRELQEYERILEPMAAPSARQKALMGEIKAGRKLKQDVSALEAEYKECSESVQSYLAENQDEINRRQARLYLARLKEREIGDLRQGRIEVGRWKVQIKDLVAALEKAYVADNPDFATDVQRINGALRECHEHQAGKRTVSRSQLSLTDAVNLRTHFLIGERPVQSCQHYDSGGGYNGGLLSYVVDPHVRIIQIYNQDGTIIARSVMRLLEDPEGKPQLFLERLYSVNTHPKVYEAMVKIARDKAEAMNVELFSHTAESNDDICLEDAVRALRCRSSRSSYIYTDAGGGLCENGEFSIPGAVRVAGKP